MNWDTVGDLKKELAEYPDDAKLRITSDMKLVYEILAVGKLEIIEKTSGKTIIKGCLLVVEPLEFPAFIKEGLKEPPQTTE